VKAVLVDNSTKMLGHRAGVDHISFEVGQGEILELLGASAVGKASTIMMLATVPNLSSGIATVGGCGISGSGTA